ncbi:hypothetical protein SO3561_09876 [Streptomyces olivochromogenes]|uniref:Uncharacterized protein n=2 Tax=Streptomyces olivochromogenes TaxID=1963 RepID=A0A250VW06_STROL|nr:hypothetical protein SO3561_09876 [Streptomyces olivochromogenes]
MDAKDSTRLPSIQHAPLIRFIIEIIHRGLEDAGLSEMRREFESNTGDGLAFGFDPSWLPLVISPFADVLDTLLHRHNTGAGPHIRLRMSIHVGPVPVTPGLPGDGNAAPRSETHRLLDCEAARGWLADAGEDGTPLVVIVSDAVHRAVVLGGYCAVPPSRFTEVQAEVTGKDFAQSAWMYVPSPSGGLLRRPVDPTAPVKRPTGETEGVGGASVLILVWCTVPRLRRAVWRISSRLPTDRADLEAEVVQGVLEGIREVDPPAPGAAERLMRAASGRAWRLACNTVQERLVPDLANVAAVPRALPYEDRHPSPWVVHITPPDRADGLAAPIRFTTSKQRIEGQRLGALAEGMGLRHVVHRARRPGPGRRIGTLSLAPYGSLR